MEQDQRPGQRYLQQSDTGRNASQLQCGRNLRAAIERD